MSATPAGRPTQWLAALVAGVLLAVGVTVSAPAVIDIDVGGDEAGGLTGVYAREVHLERRVRWTDGDARLGWAGVVGVVPEGVEVEFAPFPGRAGDQAVISAGGTRLRHAMAEHFDVVWLPFTRAATTFAVEIRSDHHLAPPDTRRLGVRLDRISIHNGPAWPRLAALSVLAWGVLVGAGALAFLAGRWVTGVEPGLRVSSLLVGAAGVLLLGVGLSAARLHLLSDVGLRALGCACLLGVALVVLLRRGGAYGRGQAVSVAAGAGLVWLALVTSVTPYFVDVPRWDIWETVALIEQAFTGEFALASLWSAHNEHRPLTGRLVVMGTALWAHWNHWWELAALLAMPLLQLLLMASFAARPLPGGRRVHPVALVASAIVLCSLTQWENWLRGYHVHILVGAVAPIAALLVLAQWRATWVNTALAAALALLGEWSFGTGLVAWPLGAVVIAMRRDAGWQVRLGAWLVVSGVAIALYFPGLPPRAGREASMVGQLLSLRGVVRLAAGVLVPIAMPVAYLPDAFAGPVSPTQVLVVGLAGAAVALASVLVVRAWWRDGLRDRSWLFPAALIAFGLAACLLAALGRVSMGLYAMTASRYLVFSAAFWVGLLCLLGREATGARRGTSLAALVVLVVTSVAALAAWPRAIPYMEHDAWSGRAARAQLRRGDVGAAAATLYPDPEKLARMREVLVRRGLSLFRPGAE